MTCSRSISNKTRNEKILDMTVKLEQISRSLIWKDITIIQMMCDLVQVVL